MEEEIDQIERAAAAANISIETHESSDNSKERTMSSQYKLPNTMKEAAVEALKAANRGMTANEILKIVNDILGTNYPRSSLSPQLSRLKSDGIVYRADDRWVLATHDHAAKSSDLNENGASEDAPELAGREGG
ncbi:hypothetical protein [Mesorhizobium metallidurans]|uniref:hypothetical protein n=1 Tax=Mesorhizobium metallidurans TaxID=489722 RepID=UPI0012FA3B38|nr:hypothetical protein [Mesorhizobium metallidurans]